MVKTPDAVINRRQSFNLQTSPKWMYWMQKKREAMGYLDSVIPVFRNRDENARTSFDQRHGLIKANVPPSHREVLPDSTSKKPNEIIVRLVSLLTATFPKWIFKADAMSTTAGLRASDMSLFIRSLFMGLEDRTGVPLLRLMMDEALGKGGSLLKVNFRLDRWANLPFQDPDESDKDYRARVRDYKARHIPFDLVVPDYATTYYDRTTDGLVRVIESYRASVYDIASEFGGYYDDEKKVLHIPFEEDTGEVDEYGDPVMFHDTIHVPSDSREVDYVEYWKQGECAVFCVGNTPIHYQELEPDLPLPYFLALGEVTSSSDPGRMGLPILYNAFEEFDRKNNLRAMEDAFLYKHGFARLVRERKMDNMPALEEPDQPEQEEEEEVIGEVIDIEQGERVYYVTPANVSALFADAKADVEREIDAVALADILMGKLPPAGTTGYLVSQLAVAATSKYVPILTQQAHAIRNATVYILDLIDRYLQSEVVVNMASDERVLETYATYKPGYSKGNRNLEVRIEAPLPSDIIQKSEWLMKGHQFGAVSMERVQREGFKIENPELENEKRRIERFEQFYEPIAMLRAQKRAGQFDLVLEAAQAGILPPDVQQLVMAFASGPDGQRPALGPGAISGNPNGMIAPAPGLGEPAIPTVGATANARPVAGPASVSETQTPRSA